MYKKWISATYAVNIILQSFLSLLMPVGFALLVSFLATDRWGAPGWIYAPLVSVATILGFISMIRFILTSMRALERLEEEQRLRAKEKESQAEKNKQRIENPNNTKDIKE
jgi:uncharacterized membrane protein YcjF (UPF0283 family)